MIIWRILFYSHSVVYAAGSMDGWIERASDRVVPCSRTHHHHHPHPPSSSLCARNDKLCNDDDYANRKMHRRDRSLAETERNTHTGKSRSWMVGGCCCWMRRRCSAVSLTNSLMVAATIWHTSRGDRQTLQLQAMDCGIL